MEMTFIGAARTVTGSLHLLEVAGQKFLLECGLYQGHRDEAERINRTFPFKPKDICAVILTHAHLDHSGNLPSLVKRGFSGPIYCVDATKDIASLLLLDSASIQEKDIEYFNKRQAGRAAPGKEPLYTVKDAEKTIRQLVGRGYEEAFEPINGVKIMFYDAGHILGSALILLEIEGKRILFTGDLGRKKMPILRDPVIVRQIDCLVIESTYGNRTHPSFEGMAEELKSLIEGGRSRRSKMIIPAFAVERTQILIRILKEQYEQGTLKGIPVYVDSPLATDVTRVYEKHPECYDEETHQLFLREDPFNFPGLIYLQDAEASRKLNDKKETMIIIAGSGMCEGGRVLHHLSHSLQDADNMVIFAGFQGQGTLGRRILEGAERVSIFGDQYPVRASIHSLPGLSAHADQQDLCEYVRALQDHRLKRIFIVHGELEPATALKEKLSSLVDIEIAIPQSLSSFHL